MTTQHETNELTNDDQPMPLRREDWCFGGRRAASGREAAWWERHEPTVDRWLREMEARRDPWWQSAEHAAFCLAARDETWSWEGFSVQELLFRELWEGGTMGVFGSIEKFFEHVVEALERFVADGLVSQSQGERWLEEMREARADFMRCYVTGSEEEAIAIARRRLRTVATLR